MESIGVDAVTELKEFIRGNEEVLIYTNELKQVPNYVKFLYSFIGDIGYIPKVGDVVSLAYAFDMFRALTPDSISSKLLDLEGIVKVTGLQSPDSSDKTSNYATLLDNSDVFKETLDALVSLSWLGQEILSIKDGVRHYQDLPLNAMETILYLIALNNLIEKVLGIIVDTMLESGDSVLRSLIKSYLKYA